MMPTMKIVQETNVLMYLKASRISVGFVHMTGRGACGMASPEKSFDLLEGTL